jgi:uncharacterized protein (TIGR00251 family)
MTEARVTVRLRPRGHADELLGLVGDVLQAKVTAPPVEGKANRALCRLVAKRAGVAPSRVSVVRGEKSRDKVLLVAGLDEPTLMERLGA